MSNPPNPPTTTFAAKKITEGIEYDIVRLLISDQDFIVLFGEHLHKNYFREILQPIVAAILHYWKQYNKRMPQLVLVNELKYFLPAALAEETLKKTISIIDDLYTQAKAPEYVENEINNFISFRRVHNALYKSMNDFEQAEKDGDLDKLYQLQNLLARASEPLKTVEPTWYMKGLDQRTEYRAGIDSGDISYHAVPMGVEGLDMLLVGYGMMPGDLGIVAGRTGGGKSIYLNQCAYAACYNPDKFANRNVLYVTYELEPRTLENRTDSMGSGVNYYDLVDERLQVRKAIQLLQEERPFGEIAFLELPAGISTVKTIRNELERLRRLYNFTPGLICIDYLDLMSSEKQFKEGGWEEQINISKDLKELAKNYKCPVWTATQGNRGARHKAEENQLMTDADIAESYGKNAFADVVITLNRTKDMEQAPDPKPLMINVVKNRSGATGKVGVLTDFSVMRMYVGKYDENTYLQELAEKSEAMEKPKKKKSYTKQ